MKIVDIKKCSIDVVECDCGYHLGLDASYLDQVGDFITECPACQAKIDTSLLYDDND